MHGADREGWVMWVHTSAEGDMRVSVRPEWERGYGRRAKVREWARAGVQAAVVDGGSEVWNEAPTVATGGGRGSGERSAG
eukprot:4959750-Prymnesium_polylepis.1